MRSQFNPSRRQFLAALPAAGLLAGIPAIRKPKGALAATAYLTPSGGDDGPQIQAALNAGGRVSLSAGDWSIQTPVTVGVADQAYWLEGQGDATRLTVSCNPGIWWKFPSDIGHVRVSNMRIKAAANGQAGSLIAAYPTSGYTHGRFVAENLTFEGGFSAGGLPWSMTLYAMQNAILRGIRMLPGLGYNSPILIDTESANTIVDGCVFHGYANGLRLTARNCEVTNSIFTDMARLEIGESGGNARIHALFDGADVQIWNQSGGPVVFDGSLFTQQYFPVGGVAIGALAHGVIEGVHFDGCIFGAGGGVYIAPSPSIGVLQFKGCTFKPTGSPSSYPIVVSPQGPSTIDELIIIGCIYDGISHNSLGLLNVGVERGSLRLGSLDLRDNLFKDWNGGNRPWNLVGISMVGSASSLNIPSLSVVGNRVRNTRSINRNEYLIGTWGPLTIDAWVEGNDFRDLVNREIAVGNGAVVNATYKRNRGLDE